MILIFRMGAVLLAGVMAASTAGCGGDDGAGGGTAEGGTLSVLTAFYPLQWMVEQVGGDRVEVESLTPPGAEPHDLELTPRDVAAIQDADVVVVLDGFQPAVDEAVAEVDPERVFDAARATELDLTYTPIEEGEEEAEEAGATDPHFWLDPTLFTEVGTTFATFLGERDPDGAQTYSANGAAMADELATLDAEMESGLASCERRDLVTSHNAFGYLARRYDLTQVGITGLTPEAEPSPADLAAVADFVRENDVRTIYFETLVSPGIADTLANETGAATEVLDPIEGLNDESQGDDYLAIMRANLVNLQRGQPCP